MGAGESEVLTWARQHPEFEALLDDRAARNCAITFSNPVRGTLGIILLAKRQGLITLAGPVLRDLTNAGLRITPEILSAALKIARE